MALYLDVRVGDRLDVGGSTITLVKKSGRMSRLKVDAPASVSVKLIKTERPDRDPVRLEPSGARV